MSFPKTHAISEFKSLYIPKFTYELQPKGTSIQAVVQQFGNPTKSEETSTVGVKTKLLYYPAKDEFGNSVLALLTFEAVCADGGATLDCYRLMEVTTRAQ